MSKKDGKQFRDRVRLPNGILYRARKRTSVHNDFIPLSEQQEEKNPITEVFGKIKIKLPKRRLPANTRGKALFIPDAEGEKNAQRAETVLTSLQTKKAKKFYSLTAIICGAVIAASFLFVFFALSKQEHKVYLYDGGREFTAETTAETVGEFLKANSISIGEDDYLETPSDTPIEDDLNIIIRRAMKLTVKNGTESTPVTMVAGTVGEALQMAGIEKEEGDEVYPSEDAFVRSGMTIDYINVDVEYVTETKSVGFSAVTVETDELYKGERKITQEGREGEKEVVYKQIYKNGALYSSEVDSETVTKEPVNEVTAIGTKIKEEPKPEVTESSSGSSKSGSESGSSGSSGSSKKSESKPSSGSSGVPASVPAEGVPAEIQDQIAYAVKSEVTAYSSYDDPSGVGSSGAYLSYGSLSADINVFPYGTKIYVPGYGVGYVVDTGSAINGNDIDVYLGDQPDGKATDDWGRKFMTVYVLK